MRPAAAHRPGHRRFSEDGTSGDLSGVEPGTSVRQAKEGFSLLVFLRVIIWGGGLQGQAKEGFSLPVLFFSGDPVWGGFKGENLGSSSVWRA